MLYQENNNNYGNNSKKLLNHLRRIPKITTFFLKELGVDITKKFKPFNPFKTKEETDLLLNQQKQNLISYTLNALGLYEVNDIKGAEENARLDGE